MHRRFPSLVAFAATGLLAAACTSSVGDTTVPPTTTTSTIPASSSTSTLLPPDSTTTTTTEPIENVEVEGDLPNDLLAAIAAVLSWQRDERNAAPPIPAGLAEHLSEYPIATEGNVEVAGTTAELDEGRVGVATTEAGDILLASDDGSGWQIVGANPADGPPWYGEEPRMVMVLGSDARPGGDQQTHRGDSIHLITANPSEGTAAILGFPRDSWVSTPFGSMKFTSLMAGRGPQVMVDQVVNTWELPVEGYVVTGFVGFEDLMGDVGRLPIVLPRAIPTQKNWPGWRAGPQTFSPQRTLEYSRTRKKVPGGDLTRSANQGVVMLAVLRLLQMNDITDAPEIVSVLLDHTWTSLAPADLIQLAATLHTLDPDTIENVVLPGNLGRAGAASVVRLTSAADDMLADLGDDGLLNDSL